MEEGKSRLLHRRVRSASDRAPDREFGAPLAAPPFFSRDLGSPDFDVEGPPDSVSGASPYFSLGLITWKYFV